MELSTQPGYLIRVRKLNARAHIWTGTDTACRMWSTGGLGTRGYEVQTSPGGRAVCQLCSARKTETPQIKEEVAEVSTPLADEIRRQVALSVRAGRNLGLDVAISICEDLAQTDHSAEACVRVLRDMREILNPKMDS